MHSCKHDEHGIQNVLVIERSSSPLRINRLSGCDLLLGGWELLQNQEQNFNSHSHPRPGDIHDVTVDDPLPKDKTRSRVVHIEIANTFQSTHPESDGLKCLSRSANRGDSWKLGCLN